MSVFIFGDPVDQHLTTSEAIFLHALWRFARRDQEMPEEAELPCIDLDHLRADLMILRPTEPDDWICEHCGDHLQERAPSAVVGQRISQSSEWQVLNREVYRRARDEERPLAMLIRTHEVQERLVLPVAANGRLSGLYVLCMTQNISTDTAKFGVFILQFQRDAEGAIIGAALAAIDIPGASGGEGQLSSAPMMRVPSLSDPIFWDRCVAVAENRQSLEWAAPAPTEDGLSGFHLRVSPYLDGVVVALAEASEDLPRQPTSSLTPAA